MQAQESHVVYLPKAFPNADRVFEQLKEQVGWHVKKWGRSNLPRLVCHDPHETPAGMEVMKWLAMYFEQKFGTRIILFGTFGNYYRNGNDYLPHHKDQYADEDGAHHVISISFGATRRFSFKPEASADSPAGALGFPDAKTYDLAAGDVIVFDPYMNEYYRHGIPKCAKAEPRINITCFVRFQGLSPYILYPKAREDDPREAARKAALARLK